MHAYEIGPQTGLDSLRPVSRAMPEPGPGEVRLKVLTLALNHRDMMVLEGRYGPRKPETRIPCSEGVARVDALGPGVNGLTPGDLVVAPHFVTWLDGPFSPSAFAHDVGITHDGWLAEYLVMPAAALIKAPASLTPDQLAPLASSALTAWHAITETGPLKPSDTVLTLGTGGVSIFALQLARLHGARVAITSSSDEKLELARSLGADITINYRTRPDWGAALLEATGGAGANIVVENGGLNTLSQSITAAAVNGRIIIIGALGGMDVPPLPNWNSIIGKNLSLKGIAEGSRAMLARLVETAARHNLQPVIDRVFPFNEAPAAYAYLHAAGHMGKVLIKVAD